MKYITVIVCVMFILAGCSDIMAPPVNRQDRNLKISVSGDAVGTRTLFPKSFTKYVLSFSGPAANGHPDIPLENGQTSVVIKAADLGTGELTITAKGYVLVSGTEYEAAEGSDTITVSSGPLPSPIIYLKASMSGDNGFLTYSVSFPSSLVNSAELSIRPYDGGSWEYRNLSNGVPGSISLEPGYYLMLIQLYNDYRIAEVTEVVHIYSNMETEANYAFTENDFTKMITLSGTIDVKINGQVPESVYVYAYLDGDYNNYLAYTWSNDGTWSMRLAASDTAIPLYFRVEAYHNGGWFYKEIGNQGGTITNVNQPGINLGTVNFSAITLSGTVDDITVDGAAPSNAWVRLYRDENYYDSFAETWIDVSEKTWSLMIEPFTADTTLYFGVEVYTDKDEWFSKGIGKSITVKDQDVSNISLGTVSFNPITLSGTISVTYGGSPVSWVVISAYTFPETRLGETWLNDPVADTPWSISILAFDTPTDIVLQVNGGYFYEYVTVSGVSGDDIDDITLDLYPLKPVSPVSLSADTWKDGNITTNFAVDWYSITVTAGTTYYLWWNDSYQGDGTQTLDVDVYVAYGDGGTIFYQIDSAWYYPQEFYASSSGTVYIRVRAYNGNGTGTYRIVYSTSSSSKPGG